MTLMIKDAVFWTISGNEQLRIDGVYLWAMDPDLGLFYLPNPDTGDQKDRIRIRNTAYIVFIGPFVALFLIQPITEVLTKLKLRLFLSVYWSIFKLCRNMRTLCP